MRVRARWYATGELQDWVSHNGRFMSAGRPDPAAAPDREAGWAAPALFDLQVNGCCGVSFTSPGLTTDAIRHVVQVCRRHGIAGLCPTLITQSAETLLHGFTVVRRACESDAEIARAVPALHLEGPYISPVDGARGAHPRCHVRPPDWDEYRRFQEASGGRIRLLTLAPEHDGALSFIEKLTASGVVAAIGHTLASAARLRDAVLAGARLSTHLGNGCPATLPRHDNPIWEQLANDALWASVICDGWHLPAAVARCILRVKTPARTVLTCDASSLAGLPPGLHREGDQEWEVLPSGKVIVPGTDYLAGSGVFTDACVGWAVRNAGVSLRDAVDMASARPRELLGLPDAGSDLVLFESEPGDAFRVTTTVTA